MDRDAATPVCRLTAYLGAPAPVSTLMYGGDHPLLEQAWAPRELLDGTVNADGWGVAWWRDGRAVRLARAEPAWFDPEVRPVLEGIFSGCGLAALRNATPGLPVGPSAVPPFVHDRWSFVLNGYVPAFRERHMRALREGLPDHLYGALAGSTDTETLFLMAVAALEEGAGLAGALERVVRTVLVRVADHGGGECQLTLLLSDGDGLAFVRTSNVGRTNSLYVSEGGPLAPDGVLVASEPLDREGSWQPVTPHQVVEIGADGAASRPLPPDDAS